MPGKHVLQLSEGVMYTAVKGFSNGDVRRKDGLIYRGRSVDPGEAVPVEKLKFEVKPKEKGRLNGPSFIYLTEGQAGNLLSTTDD